MALAWEVGRVLGEEQRDYVHTCLFQLDYFRKFVKRTGLIAQADRIGWWMGDEVYSGLTPYDAISDHLNRILAILELPLFEASVDDGYGILEGAYGPPERLVSLDGQDISHDGGEVTVSEEDLVITVLGKQRDLDRMARLWPKLMPRHWRTSHMIFCHREYQEPGDDTTLIERFEREEPVQPHICVLMVNALFEQETVYETFFEVLVRTWEVERDAAKRKRKARLGNGLRGRRSRQRARRRARANRALPGAGKAARARNNGLRGCKALPHGRPRGPAKDAG